MKTTTLECPHCGKPIKIGETLQAKVNIEFQQQLDEAKQEIEAEYAEKLSKTQKQLEAKYVQKSNESITEAISKAISDRLPFERQKIQREVQEQSEMKLLEKDTLILNMSNELKELQKKLIQGPVQRQGEAQELAIEAWLRSQFPMDDVTEIKKGAKGADTLQMINTHSSQNCGTIYYESKRHKTFQNAWIGKFKEDVQAKNATIGVIVTEVLPNDMERFGMREGIWICTYPEFKGLCFALRHSIIMIDEIASKQENSADKMAMLYDYLTGLEFRRQLEGIVDSFIEMQGDLDKERRWFDSSCKKREKQIQRVLLNVTSIYSTTRGIAGSAIPGIKSLELPEETSDIEN